MTSDSFIPQNKELFYSYDGSGNFNTEVKAHGDSDTNIFLQQMWDNFHDRLLQARSDVLNGKKSPLCYHMERIRLDLFSLSVYLGFKPWTVKRHFKPSVYKHLKPAVKAKYAEVFELTIEQLDDIYIE